MSFNQIKEIAEITEKDYYIGILTRDQLLAAVFILFNMIKYVW